MSDATGLPCNLAEYGKKHRARENQFGYVKLVGEREKKWEGHYNRWTPAPDGGGKWAHRTIILGTKAEIPTKGKAEQALRDWLVKRDNQPAASTPEAIFRSLAEDHFEIAKAGWGEEWTTTVRGMYNQILLPALGDRPIKEITAEELKRFINSLPNRTWYSVKRVKRGGEWVYEKGTVHHGIAADYVHKIIVRLKAIFDLAVDKEPPLLFRNPARNKSIRLTVPQAANEAVRPLLPQPEFHRLLEGLSRRDRLIAWIFMLGGLRPNEVFAQYRRTVGMDRMYIEKSLNRWRRLKPPKKNKTREVLLPTILRADLQAWIEDNHIGPDDLLFPNTKGNFMNRSNFLKRNIRPAAVRAGIKTTVDLRTLRRTFSTGFYALTKDTKSTQAQMGHARPDLTLGVYAQDVDPERAAGLERFERVMHNLEPWPREVLEKLMSKGIAMSEKGVGLIQ